MKANIIFYETVLDALSDEELMYLDYLTKKTKLSLEIVITNIVKEYITTCTKNKA